MNTVNLTDEERKAVNRSILRLAKGGEFTLNVTVSLEHAAIANALRLPLSAILEEGIEKYIMAQRAEEGNLTGTPSLKKEPTIIPPKAKEQNQVNEVTQLPLPHEQPRQPEEPVF